MAVYTDDICEVNALFVDLHGFGTVRSWYVQMGYKLDGETLQVVCHAFSYSSDAPRFWQVVQTVGFNEWHTFELEISPTDSGWGFLFEFLLDGENVAEYSPPDRWDGDNRHHVLWEKIVFSAKMTGSLDKVIAGLADNYYGNPACQ